MKSNTQNPKIEAITEKTLVLGIDVGSETHYARAFAYKKVNHGFRRKIFFEIFMKLINNLGQKVASSRRYSINNISSKYIFGYGKLF